MESLSMLALLVLLAVCAVVLLVLLYRFVTRKQLSRRCWIIAIVALLPIAGVVGEGILNANTEYNPSNASVQQIAGHYSNGDALLILRADGTYSSRNFADLGSGTWSHFDWNLTFSDSSLEQPRWIIRRGRPAILPYYSGADGSDGLALIKQESEQDSGDNGEVKRGSGTERLD